MSVERTIIRSNEFEPSNLSFKEVRTMPKVGAQFSPVEYDGKRLCIQTPEMLVPFGLSQFKDKEGKVQDENAAWSLDLSFAGEDDEGSPLKDFHDRLDKAETVLVNAAHGGSWMKDKKNKDHAKRGKSVSKKVIMSSVTQLVKYSTSEKAIDENGKPKFPPTMRVKVPYKDGRFGCEAYDENKELITEQRLDDLLTKGTRVRCLLECGAVYISANSLTLSFRLCQVIVRKSGRMAGYGFLEDSGDENSESGSENENDSDEKPKMENSDSDNNDSDNNDSDNNDSDNNESENDSESEEEEVVKPVPKKGKGRKAN
jgi:hypothetical protein